MDSTNDLRRRENMKKRQRKKEYKKNRNRNVIVPLIPVKVNQKEKKDMEYINVIAVQLLKLICILLKKT